MESLIVNLNDYPAALVLQQEVGAAAVLVDIIEVVLGVEVSGFLRPKGLAEQADEEVLRHAAGGGMAGLHPGHLNSL